MAFTPEALAQLEAQRAYFSSAEHRQSRAALWREATPEQCLAAVIEQCREAEYFLMLKTPAELERLVDATPIPQDTVDLLEALQRVR